MKRIFNIANKFVLLVAGVSMLASCNEYLDKMPDNRTELNSAEKLTQMLVSAYSTNTIFGILELMSDNVTDYGSNVAIGYTQCQEAYFLEPITSEDSNSPSVFWSSTYGAIAAANHVLEAVQEYKMTNVDAQLGEAYLCRAFAHFCLANAFCQAYNPETCETDLGIAYVEEAENQVFVDRPRGTMAELYAKIAADIEAGVPLIDDTNYQHPKFHFNKRAAQAFAARFYLYYGKYDKAYEYAKAALTENPRDLFRDWSVYIASSSSKEYGVAYVSTQSPANFFCMGMYANQLRYRSYRYIASDPVFGFMARSNGPWGGTFPPFNTVYVTSSRAYWVPKLVEFFMYTDEVAGIGFPWVDMVVFTTEKTLMDMAEICVMLKQYDEAAKYLNLSYASLGIETALSAQEIADWYASANSNYRKEMASRFPLEEGMQTDLLHACLHIRRVFTSGEGERLCDLKRYGIAYTHVRDGQDNIEIEPYDKRLAVQIPGPAMAAGVTPNPR